MQSSSAWPVALEYNLAELEIHGVLDRESPEYRLARRVSAQDGCRCMHLQASFAWLMPHGRGRLFTPAKCLAAMWRQQTVRDTGGCWCPKDSAGTGWVEGS